MESTYLRIKDAKIHPSPYTQRFFKRFPYLRVWAMGRKEDTLRSLKQKGLKAELWLGVPNFKEKYMGKNYNKGRSFTGRRFSTVWHGNYHGRSHGCYIGLGGKGGVWMIDVTDLFVQEYLKFGMCALHGNRHEYILKSPMIRECKICKFKQKKKIVVKREISWENVKI